MKARLVHPPTGSPFCTCCTSFPLLHDELLQLVMQPTRRDLCSIARRISTAWPRWKRTRLPPSVAKVCVRSFRLVAAGTKYLQSSQCRGAPGIPRPHAESDLWLSKVTDQCVELATRDEPAFSQASSVGSSSTTDCLTREPHSGNLGGRGYMVGGRVMCDARARPPGLWNNIASCEATPAHFGVTCTMCMHVQYTCTCHMHMCMHMT